MCWESEMETKRKEAIFLTIYYLSPIVVSILYWLEEPLDSGHLLKDLIHRSGSILGIFGFMWMCFNIIIAARLRPIEKGFSLEGLIKFHTLMAAIALVFMILHYPMVRLEREYSSFQIRSGSIGFQLFFLLMVLSLFFMSNKILNLKITKKLRIFAFKKKFSYKINKTLHNLMILGVILVFIHTLLGFTSQNSLLMRSLYSFFLIITLIGWVYHKLMRRFQKERDPFVHRKAQWDKKMEFVAEQNAEWALSLIKNNPSLYPCLQCGECTRVCAVSEVTKGEYNPRRNILYSLLGYAILLIEGDELVIWGCTNCHFCEEICPQDIELTKTFSILKNQSFSQGKGPVYVFEQAKAIFENAHAIPLQSAIERRREELSLPITAKPDLNELQTLLRNLGIEEKLKLRKY